MIDLKTCPGGSEESSENTVSTVNGIQLDQRDTRGMHRVFRILSG